MGSISKLPSGKWRAQVAKNGVRRSKAFATKTAAKDWAARQEYLIENAGDVNSRMLFGDLLDRYAREVSTHKKGARWEIVRIERMKRDPVALVALGDLSATDIARWRDKRLCEVMGASVRREMELLSGPLRKARLEWGLMSHNPMDGVRVPKQSPPRDRLPTDAEIEALRISAGDDLSNATARAFHAWLFSIETAMRAGEVAGLLPEHVDLAARTAWLPDTKNGTARHVPLSREAVRLIEALPGGLDGVFGLTASNISTLFAKLRKRAGVDGLTYHDSRHAAITRLAKKLHVLDLARMVGHRDIRQLQAYYNTSASDIAKLLD